MININLFRVLKTFSENEWEGLILYVKSIDAVSRRKYLPLILELKYYRVKPDALQKIPASEIFSKAYKKNYSTQTLFNRQNELLNLLKKYLKIIAYEKNELLQKFLYFEELISRNLFSLLSRESKNINEIVDFNIYNEHLYNTLSNILENRSSYYSLNNDSVNSVNTYYKFSRVLLADILNNLFRAGEELQILKLHNVNQNNSLLNFIDSIDSDNYFNELEKQNEPIFIVPLIRYYIFKSLQHLDCKRYIIKAKQIFFANEKQFTEDFNLHVYGKIMSYYNIKASMGEQKYFKDLYLLYKRKLKQNLVSDFKEHYFFYNNVFCEYVITGLKVKQFKWVEMVIKKYSHLLTEDIREDEYTLAMIRLHFAKKEYEETIEIINSGKIKNKKLYLDSRYYKLQSYFELEKYEECFLEIDNIRHYLKNNRLKILGVRINNLKNFLYGFSKLLKYRTNSIREDASNIFYEFEKSEILKTGWIYEKLQEISG